MDIQISHPHPLSPASLEDASLRGPLKFSILVHVGLALILIAKEIVLPSKSTPYIPALRVDIVGLPDLLKKDQSKIGRPPTEEKKAEPNPEVKEKISKTKPLEKTPDGMILPDEARKKKIQSALARVKALNKVREDESVDAPIRGNILSKGSSLSGEAKESSQESYYDSVHQKLKDNWELPVWLSRQNYSAQVAVFLSPRGLIEGIRFVKSSGNPRFDEYVKETILKSQPFAAPPPELRENLLANGILLGFPL